MKLTICPAIVAAEATVLAAPRRSDIMIDNNPKLDLLTRNAGFALLPREIQPAMERDPLFPE